MKFKEKTLSLTNLVKQTNWATIYKDLFVIYSDIECTIGTIIAKIQSTTEIITNNFRTIQKIFINARTTQNILRNC